MANNIKYHVDNWPEYHDQGLKGGTTVAPIKVPQKLSEPVPNYSKLPGDLVLESEEMNNNAIIVLGRDRHPFGPYPRSTSTLETPGSDENPADPNSTPGAASGYSDYMRAGAIDIVVGRGAPYPVKKSLFKTAEQLPPLYQTQDITADGLGGTTLRTDTPGEPRGELKHPGYVMDAARIYLSQMCQVDDYFGIRSEQTLDRNPSSAIMLKADKLRMHSRRDIYIVAGGDQNTPTDSNGHTITSDEGKIHLMPLNGLAPRGQTAAVRADMLIECLTQITACLQNSTELLNSFLMRQNKFNATVSNHVYGTGAGMSTCDPTIQTCGQITSIQGIKDLLQLNAVKMSNITNITLNYLGGNAKRSIASKHVFLA